MNTNRVRFEFDIDWAGRQYCVVARVDVGPEEYEVDSYKVGTGMEPEETRDSEFVELVYEEIDRRVERYLLDD